MASVKSCIHYLICFFLLIPYLLIFRYIDEIRLGDLSEIYIAFKNSMIQSSLSALATLILGLFGSLGILAINHKSKFRRIVEGLFLLPGFIPPIFIVLTLLNLLNPFPVGMFGIVLAHSIISYGIVSIILVQSMESKLGHLAEVALSMGSGRLLFWKRVAFPAIKGELWTLFLFLFTVFFASFSIPMLLSGGLSTSLELLIYEKLRSDSGWGEAFCLSLLQFGVLFIFGLSLNSKTYPDKRFFFNLELLKSKTVLGFFLIFYIVLILSYIKAIFPSQNKWHIIVKILFDSHDAIITSFFLAITVGIGLYFFLNCMLFCLPNKKLNLFLNGFTAPSTAIAGFGFVAMGGHSAFENYIKIAMALILIYVCGLYRLGLKAMFQSISQQLQVAEVLGASVWQRYSKITWPQLNSRLLMVSGLGAAWTCGDYGLSRILAHSDFTFALVVQSLLSSYRMELAGPLSAVLLLFCVSIFFLFYGVGYVFDKKS